MYRVYSRFRTRVSESLAGCPLQAKALRNPQRCHMLLACRLYMSIHRTRRKPGMERREICWVCEDRIGTGPPRARTEVIYVDLEGVQPPGVGHPAVWPTCTSKAFRE